MNINEKFTKKRKKKWLVVLLVLLAIAGGVCWFLIHQLSPFDNNAHDYADPVRKGKKWTTEQLVFPGFGEVPVKQGDKNIKIILGNSKVNKAYFKYKVTVKQGKKNITVLDTKLIKPGNAITRISTKKLQMKKGKYPMRIKVCAFSLKNRNAPLNGSMVDATLVVN
ncbi:MAG: hypothetical protein ACLRPU_00235 [Enterococcus hulanensis]